MRVLTIQAAMHTHNARRYDYRLCFRQSATERLRSLQAIASL